MAIQIAKTAQAEWKPLVEDGVNTQGIYVKPLRIDPVAQRAPTFLLKFEAGASYPNHIHPMGEEAFVMEGSVRFGAQELSAGDYLYTPPGEKHSVYSKSGCTILFIVPPKS